MRRLWAPWRMAYLAQDDVEGCVFCQKLDEDKDRENLILFRGRTACIMLNLYPYNTGHVMIIPHEHMASLEDLSAEASMELLRLLQESLTIIRKVLRPGGFNIGANIGKAAGAGIDGHMHLHIVPRWEGDTNFMPILAETRVIPEQLLDTFDKLKKEFDALGPDGRRNQ